MFARIERSLLERVIVKGNELSAGMCSADGSDTVSGSTSIDCTVLPARLKQGVQRAMVRRTELRIDPST